MMAGTPYEPGGYTAGGGVSSVGKKKDGKMAAEAAIFFACFRLKLLIKRRI